MIPNLEQWKSIIRAACVAAGGILTQHNLATPAQSANIVNWLYAGILIFGPIIWSIWSKTHAAQAAQAVKLVNSVEAIVGDASSNSVQIVPGLPLKPTPALSDPPLPMNKVTSLLLLAGISMMGLAGCVTNPGQASTWAVIVSGGEVFSLDILVPPFLDRNPSLAPVLAASADGITTAFGSGDLTPEAINKGVATLGARYNLPASAQAIIVKALNKGLVLYSRTFGVQVASATNPNVVELLQGLASGVKAGVADWTAKQPTGPSAFNYPGGNGQWAVTSIGPDGERFVDWVPDSVVNGDHDPVLLAPPTPDSPPERGRGLPPPAALPAIVAFY